ncbi:hypothetical protein L9F63_013167, partial [Diploptera punctata]
QSVSADALIENLLGKKETFKPKTIHHPVPSVNPASVQSVMVPGMLSGNSGTPVMPAVGYPVTPTIAQVPSGPCTSGMMGGFVSSLKPPEVKSSYTPIVSAAPQTHLSVNLPAWLDPTTPLFPPFYRQVWKIVGQEKGLVDTSRIFSLLLTSGLPTDVLGYIWGLANHKVAGQLTEQELYIVLALVGLAQNGCTFNNLNVLNLIPQPPIPNLKIINVESVESSTRDIENSVVSDQGKMKREDLNLNQFSSSAISDTNSDGAGFEEFTDFQSAIAIVPETSQLTNNNGISSIKSVASTTVLTSTTASTIEVNVENSTAKCPSVMVVSTGHGRGIGSRLANHSLGTPKQKKSKHHHHRHHHHHSQAQVTPNSLSVDDDFSEFHQAKDPIRSPADCNIEEVFPKCNLKSMPQGKTYLLKESAIRSETKLDFSLQPAEVMKSSGIGTFIGNGRLDFEVNSEGIKTDTLSEMPHTHELKFTPETETKLLALSSKDSKGEGVNLMAIEEDKYSALRNLSIANQELVLEKPQAFPVVEFSLASDEFGDFLSAEPAQVTNDSFADIAARKQVQSTNILDISKTNTLKMLDTPKVEEFQVDDWGDFKDASLAIPNQVTEDCNRPDSDISSELMKLNISGNIAWNQDISQSDASALEKEKLQIFPCSSESIGDLNLGKSWNLKFKDEINIQSTMNLNASENIEQTSPFHGFLGKIYDSKLDFESVKGNVFCSSPDVQLNDISNNFNIGVQPQDVENEDDDFGEFVGPDAWGEEQKYTTTTKDLLFDGHLGSGIRDGFYGDTQSVSSLELPSLALSRHGSVPSLDLKIFPSTSERNGGNGGNQPWDMSPQGIDHQLNEWQRCLQSCLTLLQSAVEIFSNISSEKVLDEVVSSAEGKDYLHNPPVPGLAHRLAFNLSLVAIVGSMASLFASFPLKTSISISVIREGMKSRSENMPGLTLHTNCSMSYSVIFNPGFCHIHEEQASALTQFEFFGRLYQIPLLRVYRKHDRSLQ